MADSKNTRRCIAGLMAISHLPSALQERRGMAGSHRYVTPGGDLFIGHSESLQWAEHQFRAVAPTIYRKEG